MSKIDECEKIIQSHDYRLGRPKPNAVGVTLTKEEAASLLDYLETWFPHNLRDEEEWDSLQWLYNVLSVWKKCQAAENGTAVPAKDIGVAVGDDITVNVCGHDPNTSCSTSYDPNIKSCNTITGGPGPDSFF